MLSLALPLERMTNKEEYAQFELRQKQLKEANQKPYVGAISLISLIHPIAKIFSCK